MKKRLVHMDKSKMTFWTRGESGFFWEQNLVKKVFHGEFDTLIEISQNVTTPFTTTCDL